MNLSWVQLTKRLLLIRQPFAILLQCQPFNDIWHLSATSSAYASVWLVIQRTHTQLDSGSESTETKLKAKTMQGWAQWYTHLHCTTKREGAPSCNCLTENNHHDLHYRKKDERIKKENKFCPTYLRYCETTAHRSPPTLLLINCVFAMMDFIFKKKIVLHYFTKDFHTLSQFPANAPITWLDLLNLLSYWEQICSINLRSILTNSILIKMLWQKLF